METIHLYFVKKYCYKKFSLNKLVGWIINLCTFGEYFHCGIYVYDQNDYSNKKALVIESQFPAGGVVKTTIDRYNDNVVFDAYKINVTDEQYKIIRDFLNKQVNIKAEYDLKGALSVVFRWIKHRKNKYFCSELICSAFKQADIPLSEKPCSQTSPNRLSKSEKLSLEKENIEIK